MDLTLNLANTLDAPTLKQLSLESFKEGFDLYNRYPPGIESLAWHESEIEKCHYYKVLLDGELAGGICVTPLDDEKIYLRYLFISVKHQNKRIGSKVLELIEKQYSWAKSWSLITPYKSYRNHYFYEKYGYG